MIRSAVLRQTEYEANTYAMQLSMYITREVSWTVFPQDTSKGSPSEAYSQKINCENILIYIYVYSYIFTENELRTHICKLVCIYLHIYVWSPFNNVLRF